MMQICVRLWVVGIGNFLFSFLLAGSWKVMYKYSSLKVEATFSVEESSPLDAIFRLINVIASETHTYLKNILLPASFAFFLFSSDVREPEP